MPRQGVVVALTVGPILELDAWMSQSRRSSRETQALVQSMLQRLKLQSGTEVQGGPWPACATATATRHEWRQARDRDPHQQTNGKGQNGFGSALVDSLGMGTDGDIMEEGLSDDHGHEVKSCVFRDEFGTPAQDSGVDHTATRPMVNGEQDLVNGPILDKRKAISSPLNSFPSPSCKDNTVGNNVNTGQTITSSVARWRLFPVNTQKDAEGTSCPRTNDKMEGGMEGKSINEENFIHDAMHDVVHGVVTDNCNIHSSLAGNSTSASQNPNNSNPETAESGACGSPSFSPRVYTWSIKGPITGIEEIPIAHTGNEDSGALAQRHDVKIESKMANSTTASRHRNRGFGNKTKRWTQKIKEKFKERGGSLKKNKEEEIEEGKVEEEGKVSRFK